MAFRQARNRVVNFIPGELGESIVGQLVDVRITESLDYTLRGDLVASIDTIAKAS